jgi:rhodanese-related sulfurtransferase
MRRVFIIAAFVMLLAALVMGVVACTGAASSPVPSVSSTSSPSPSGVASSPASSSAPASRVISVQEAAQLIEENRASPDFVILDVRTPAEFSEGYIAGALNIDYRDAAFSSNVDKLDKNKQYLVYCRTGARSTSAVQVMQEVGFKHLYNMTGGITRWVEEGYPTIK